MTRRRNSRQAARSPEALAASLPDELRSFDRWHYPNGLSEYMRELSRFVGDGLPVTPVMNAAGLSAADWFRHMLKDEIP